MSVVMTLSGSDCVVGLTSLNQELYVLHKRDVNQVNVYSTNSSTLYTHLRQFSIKGLGKCDDNDMASCVRRKCLYISDWNNKCVHKVAALNGDVTAKWSVSGLYRPVGLSLTPSGNLLVTCRSDWSFWSDKMLELNSETGQRVREIAQRQSNILGPLHAVQQDNHRYVVSHGGGRGLHRVCVVDVDGKVSLSYGGQRGSDVTQLDWPRHVTIDRDNFIFVADRDNRRVTLLTVSLQLLRHVKLEQRPWRLYLDHVTRRLYVAHVDSGDVTVIQV